MLYRSFSIVFLACCLISSPQISAQETNSEISKTNNLVLHTDGETNSADKEFTIGMESFKKHDGMSADNVEAVRHIENAANQGLAKAQFVLGGAYYLGDGVTKDLDLALMWIRKAAQQNNAWAQFALGTAYYKGEGVKKDEAEALDLFTKAADQGLDRAEHVLGVMYHEGRGVRKDDVEADSWWLKAAKQGNTKSQAALGAAYFKGDGVSQDDVQADMWFNLAARQNDAETLAFRSLLEESMTPDQITEAKRRAAEWKPTVCKPSSPVGQNGAY